MPTFDEAPLVSAMLSDLCMKGPHLAGRQSAFFFPPHFSAPYFSVNRPDRAYPLLAELLLSAEFLSITRWFSFVIKIASYTLIKLYLSKEAARTRARKVPEPLFPRKIRRAPRREKFLLASTRDPARSRESVPRVLLIARIRNLKLDSRRNYDAALYRGGAGGAQKSKVAA